MLDKLRLIALTTPRQILLNKKRLLLRKDRLTEMDALVAYLQILGQLTEIPQPIQPPARVMTE